MHSPNDDDDHPDWEKAIRPRFTAAEDVHGEGARPSSLITVHKLSTPDPAHDQQLLRDVAIINERVQRELGPMPPGGLPVIPKRKPKTWRHDEPPVSMNQERVDETMKLSHVAMAAALSVATVGSLNAYGSGSDSDQTKTAASTHDTPSTQVHEPHWPDNGIAERELGDGDNTYPENMFVEYSKGQWHAWVILTNLHGSAKALDFFSGNVVSAKVKNPGGYNDSFVDEHGITHKDVGDPVFDYKDPRPGGGLGGIDFSADWLRFEAKVACAPLYLNVSRRMASDDNVILWSKVPLYKTYEGSKSCPEGVWNSLVNTALDLRDGTLLITGGKYIFRIRQSDMTPAGEAPHLRVVDEGDVKRVIEQAKGKDVKDASAYLTEQLDLH